MSQIEIEVIRSRRKTLAIEITPDARVLVRAPYRISQAQIQRFVQEKSGWIEKHLKKAAERKQLAEQQQRSPRTQEEIQQLVEQALQVIPPKVAAYAASMGVTYGRITIRNQKTRWGSCSSKGNLNFNCRLMAAPERVLDYVIVHELCHRKEMNHSERFWQEVEQVMPDYREQRKWLKVHGDEL